MQLMTPTFVALTGKAGRHSTNGVGPHKPLEHFNNALHILGLVGWTGSAGAMIGAAIGFASARQLGARWDWAILWLAPLAAAIGFAWVGFLAEDAAIGSIAILTCAFGGHLVSGILTHQSDKRAGDDRAHEVGERIGPHNLLLRRRALGRLDRVRSNELAIGVTRRGRIATIKRGGKSGSHSLILGATGTGKTTVLSLMASEYARGGHGVVLVEAKTDVQLEAQARRAADAAGRPFILVSPDGPVVWDLLATGGVDETVAKLLACEVYDGAALQERGRPAAPLGGSGDKGLRLADDAAGDPAALRCRIGSPPIPASTGRRSSQGRSRSSSRASRPRSAQTSPGMRSRLAVLAESDYGRQLARLRLGSRARCST